MESEKVADEVFAETDDEDAKITVVAVRKRTPSGRKLFVYCRPSSGGEEIEYALPYVYNKLGKELPVRGF